MDLDKALKALQKIADQGKKTGDDVAGGMKKGEESSKSFGAELGNLMKAQMGLSAIKATAQAIAGEFRETTTYIMQTAKEFQGLRKSMQEVATLKGSPNTNVFTLAEARKAQGFNLTPQEFRDFQAEFQNYAGAQIGGPNGKLTEDQGEQYAGRVAAMMKASGIAPAVGAELAGSLLEQAKGPQDVEALMKKLGTTFQVLEKGRVPLSRALPQMSQIMGHGIGPEEAATMFSIAAPASPGREGIAVEAGLRAIEEMKNKGTGAEFGVTRGMGQYESVKAFAENINARKQAMVAGGMTEQMALDELTALLAERGVAANVRERRGLVAGFGRRGVELGGFKRYEQIAAESPADLEAQRQARFEASAQGKQDKIDAAQGVANAEIAKRRQIAEIELTKGGRFEKVPFQERAVAGIGSATGLTGDLRTAQNNRQVIARARAERGEATSLRDEAMSRSLSLTDELLGELIGLQKKNNELVEQAAKGTGKPIPVSETPRPAGRQ